MFYYVGIAISGNLGGILLAKMFTNATRQPMVALRLDSVMTFSFLEIDSQ